MNKIGLVLEGGGMRGLYTCGVLEFFMDKNIYFKYVVGVSAGASNAASYISRQKGRNEKVNLNFLGDWRYMSFRNLLMNKSYFGMNFIFEEIPEKHVEFDYKTFGDVDCEFWVGTTDCNTGETVYFNKDEVGKDFNILKASCSLPLLSPIVSYNGYELLDGGVSDSIPIRKSIMDGNDKHIIVLTRNKDYRKKPSKHVGFLKLKYKKYPKLVDAMVNRYKNYNDTLDYIEKLESEGEALVIRATNEIKVDRFEKNPEKLRQLFYDGYKDAEKMYEKIETFIG